MKFSRSLVAVLVTLSACGGPGEAPASIRYVQSDGASLCGTRITLFLDRAGGVQKTQTSRTSPSNCSNPPDVSTTLGTEENEALWDRIRDADLGKLEKDFDCQDVKCSEDLPVSTIYFTYPDQTERSVTVDGGRPADSIPKSLRELLNELELLATELK